MWLEYVLKKFKMLPFGTKKNYFYNFNSYDLIVSVKYL